MLPHVSKTPTCMAPKSSVVACCNRKWLVMGTIIGVVGISELMHPNGSLPMINTPPPNHSPNPREPNPAWGAYMLRARARMLASVNARVCAVCVWVYAEEG